MGSVSAPGEWKGFARPDVRASFDADGCQLLRHGLELAPYDGHVGEWLRRWAAEAPDRVAIGEWDAAGRPCTLTYGALRERCDRVARALLSRNFARGQSVALLAEKSLAQAVLTLAAMQCGITVCPVSPAYSLLPEASGRLQFCLRTIAPALVLVDGGEVFANAVSLLSDDVEVVFERTAPPNRPDATPFADLLRHQPDAEVEAAFDAVDADAPAKVLFTSGSTGHPKPVINTQRMMCSNACAQAQVFPFLERHPPVVVDWQPWHHCGGGSHNFHAVLRNGGSYYIDRGKPTGSAAFQPTLDALRQISPTLHFNVPFGYHRLALHLAQDAGLRRTFFARLNCMVVSGAAMPASLWSELDRLSSSERGPSVPIVSSYGMTEMAPLHTSMHWPGGHADMIGLPIPGSVVKLVPVAGKLELRAKGPNVTPGYYGAPALTESAFDEGGWYRSGDAVCLVDPARPELGLRLEGRLTEQFKLQTGTWVRVGDLRTAVVSATSPLLSDVLITGEGRTEVGVLAILDLTSCRGLFGMQGATLSELAGVAVLRQQLRDRLGAFNAQNPASSRRIARALLIDDVPTLATGETTDKGHINQKLALQRRARLVEQLFDDCDADVLRL